MSDELNPGGKPVVQLDPALQARLLEQMREEQAAQLRAKQIQLYVLYPFIGLVTLIGIAMAFSDDSSIAMVGHLLASSILYVLWKLRKRIGAAIGL